MIFIYLFYWQGTSKLINSWIKIMSAGEGTTSIKESYPLLHKRFHLTVYSAPCIIKKLFKYKKLKNYSNIPLAAFADTALYSFRASCSPLPVDKTHHKV